MGEAKSTGTGRVGANPVRIGTVPALLLRFSPLLSLPVLVVPVLAGLVGTIGPAFHFGGQGPDLRAFAELLAWPGLARACLLSVSTGLIATLTALVLSLLILAVFHDRAWFGWIRLSLSPLLAIPHAAAALGLAFLIAPSGWIARALSPWATGWQQPPDLLILNDPWGVSLTLGLIAKELPFVMIMAMAALPQIATTQHLRLAQTFGYGRIAGFALTVVPALYPALRLPVLAVLTYAMTSIDMGLVLGPTRPPSLAVQITLWMTDASLTRTDLAAAAALLQTGLTLLALIVWKTGEVCVANLCKVISFQGNRLRALDHANPVVAGLAVLMGLSLTLAILALALWSVAGPWPFPHSLPQSLTLGAWTQAAPALTATAGTTLAVAGLTTVAALTLTLAWLQAEALFRLVPLPPLLLYLPLIVPQVCFLPGLVHLSLQLGTSAGPAVVAAAHLIFVLPYTYLTLAGPFRGWDSRIETVAATLGARPARIFWQLRLPMLQAAVLTAAAVGFAVSVTQYLPTLLLGGGRVTTLTTEALALASGGNRRLTSAYALLQTLLPMLAFAVVAALTRGHHLGRTARGSR